MPNKVDEAQATVKELAATLFSLRLSDERGVDNYFLDQFMQEYVAVTFPMFVTGLDMVWSSQKEKTMNYGGQFNLTKVYEGKSNPKGQPFYDREVDTQVLHYSDSKSCDESEFLIIRQSAPHQVLPNYNHTVYYIRTLRKPKKDFVAYESREWSPEYYDYIDNGYVLTVEQEYGKYRVAKGVMDTFNLYRVVASMFDTAMFVFAHPDEF